MPRRRLGVEHYLLVGLFPISKFTLVSVQGVPGPGKYDSRGMFDPEPAKINMEGIEVIHPPFLSQARVRKNFMLSLSISFL